jgi:hypothetical protein
LHRTDIGTEFGKNPAVSGFPMLAGLLKCQGPEQWSLLGGDLLRRLSSDYLSTGRVF